MDDETYDFIQYLNLMGLEPTVTAYVRHKLLSALAAESGRIVHPLLKERVLTAKGVADREEFTRQYIDRGHGCMCWQHGPCSRCTHPGNPINQEEDDQVWETMLPTLYPLNYGTVCCTLDG